MTKQEGNMDRIHDVLNIVLPPVSLFLSILFFPPFLLFKLIYSLFRSISEEDVAGKVVLITGASSGIGEHLAYEYARRCACLVLVARREERLRAVADKARKLGSPDVIFICADVSVFDDCKRFVDESINHFGRWSFAFGNLAFGKFEPDALFSNSTAVRPLASNPVDHLVNNAGIAPVCFFEEYKRVADHVSVMNINFWGSVYSTQFAVPHLRKSKGKIIAMASCSGYVPSPGLSIYCATKAAQINFYETLRMELAPDVGVTIVTPGFIESEITDKEFMSKINFENIPIVSTERCAKAIMNSTVRGDRYLTEPAWNSLFFPWRFLCPEVFEWIDRLSLSTRRRRTSRGDGNACAVSNSFKSD